MGPGGHMLVSLRAWAARAVRVGPACATRLHHRRGLAVKALAGRQPLRPGDVHVWWLHPPAAGGAAAARLAERCAPLLPAQELLECGQGGEGPQLERLLARALVRSVLCGYLGGGAAPAELAFARNAHGKPELLEGLDGGGGGGARTPEGVPLRFNLTHTGSLLGLAVSAGGAVGLDVEAAARATRRDPLRVARRRFSPAEIADLEACAGAAERQSLFLALWTLKESHLKARGTGISAPPGLRGSSFRLAEGALAALGGAGAPAATSAAAASGGIEFRTSGGDGQRWEFFLARPSPGHLAALCVERAPGGGGAPVRLASFDAGRLLEEGGAGRAAVPLDLEVLAQGRG